MISNLLIFFFLIFQVDSLRIFQNTYKKKLYNIYLKNKIYEAKKYKNNSYNTEQIWKEYENDVDPPIIFEQYNYSYNLQNNSKYNK